MASRKEQKAAARERLRQEMERRKRRARRNRIIGITAAALVLVVGIAAIGVAVNNQREEEAAKRAAQNGGAPTKILDDGLSIPVGKSKAPVTLTVYEDFRCPGCESFEKDYGKTIDKLVDEGKLKVEYRLVTIIDENAGGNGSKIAANAAVCANEVGEFRQLHRVLFNNQPPESKDQFTTDRVLGLAGKVDGLADDEKFQRCVEYQRYKKWLPKVQMEMTKRFGRPSTPSLLLDDKVALGGQQQQPTPEVATPSALEQTVNARAKKAEGGAADGRPGK